MITLAAVRAATDAAKTALYAAEDQLFAGWPGALLAPAQPPLSVDQALAALYAAEDTILRSKCFVSPFADGSGTGSLERPFTLRQALLATAALVGSVDIYLLDGIHRLTAPLDATLAGSITFHRYPGHHPVVDINLLHLGIYSAGGLRFERLEFMNSFPARVFSTTPPGVYGMLDVYAPNITFEGCYLHDLTEMGVWSTAPGFRMVDTHLMNIGHKVAGAGYGHEVYTQNDGSTTYVYENVIFGPTFAFGMQAYGSSQAQVKNYYCHNCIFMNARQLWGKVGGGVTNVTLDRCYFWGCKPEFGYQNQPNGSCTITNCVLPAGIQILNFQSVTFTDNLVCTFDYFGTPSLVIYVPYVRPTPDAAPLVLNWNRNTYYGGGKLVTDGVAADTFAQWKSRYPGVDLQSTAIPSMPTQNWIYSLPCTTPGLDAHIAAYNWQQLDTVALPNTPLLRNAYNPAEVSANQVDFINRSVVLPVGHPVPLAALDKRFGAYIAEAV